MTEETIRIPKFRKTLRVGTWMEKKEYEERLPKEIEQVFFKTKETHSDRVVGLVSYILNIDGDLPEELDDLLYGLAKEAFDQKMESYSTIANSISEYCTRCYSHNGRISERFVDLLQGQSYCLLNWARVTQRRLPAHLEDSIDDPNVLLVYATEIVKGRVPSHLEQVFFKNVQIATQYAFDVIRGFAPVKLPDDLHNFVMLESFKHPNNYFIKTYVQASENDPNKTGNTTL